MNNFFSLQRFCRLFLKHSTEHYRIYFMSIAVLAGVILLGGAFLFFVIPEPPDPGLQTAIFIILMLIAGTIFTSTIFSDYGSKNKATAALTLPATAFEKFLVGWIYSYPVFLIIYSVVFYLGLIGLESTRHWGPAQHFTMFSIPQSGFYTVLTTYSFLHAIALFGAIYFNKLHFIKTGFVFFIGNVVIMIFNTLFLKVLVGLNVIKAAIPFGYLNFSIGNKYYSIVTKAVPPIAIWITLFVSAVLIWVAAYFRLKEKQV